MDTSTVAVRAETPGRRVVRRRIRGLQEKLRIIAETQAPGGSIAAVARAHGVNANLVFAWIRQHELGTLEAKTRPGRPKLLAVTVERPPRSEVSAVQSKAARVSPASGHIEIVLTDDLRIRVFGSVGSEDLERVLHLLRR